MIEETTGPADDPFFEYYDRHEPAYGTIPSADLASFLEQCPRGGAALDLGAGAGRDTLLLASSGFHVTSVDASPRGLERVRQRAEEASMKNRVTTIQKDVRELEIPSGTYDAIVATTVLDHIPPQDAACLWERMIGGLAADGILYVEVHTTDDPGCAVNPHPSDDPVSETAGWVVNYFPPTSLLRMAVSQTRLRVLRYEERFEWDYTHGHPHKHGKAVLLATTHGSHHPWYGHPAAFPKRPDGAGSPAFRSPS